MILSLPHIGNAPTEPDRGMAPTKTKATALDVERALLALLLDLDPHAPDRPALLDARRTLARHRRRRGEGGRA